MSGIPSQRMFQQQPPSAEETFRQRVAVPHRIVEQPVPASRGAMLRRAAVVREAAADRGVVDTANASAEELADASTAISRLRFEEIYSSPENQVFKVVFFPDRIFHARYLNATRASDRYRYAVSDARSVLDITVLKAQLFMDGQKLTNLIRIEYRGSRLIELARESGRFLRDEVIAWAKIEGKASKLDENGDPLLDDDGNPVMEDRAVDRPFKLHFCPWINAYQVEIWQTLEPPSREMKHHFQVLAQMGPTASITRARQFSPVIEHMDDLQFVELAFRENDVNLPYGSPISDPRWDNNFERSYQLPNSPFPNSHNVNTVPVGNYRISFQKGWFLDAADVAPVRYRNAMMDEVGNPDFVDPQTHPELNNPAAWTGEVPDESFAKANVIEMRWLLQREFGGSVVFFHEVTIPVGTVEGTHQHIGSEELYYIVAGEGEAYMAVGDDPTTDEFPRVTRKIYGLFETECVALPVKPGNVIFTKSGGIHGIRNTGDVPLKFVAFLYHTV